jgi:peptidoglycan/LPS O-acetylase OafA/YrhL
LVYWLKLLFWLFGGGNQIVFLVAVTRFENPMISWISADNPVFAAALLALAWIAAASGRRFLVSAAKPGKEYFETLEGLRGVLAVAVFIHHANTTRHWVDTGVWEAPPTRFFCQLGQPVVAMFFMLTAFLFWRRILNDRERMDWRSFVIMRFMRLAPVYLFAVGVVTVISFVVASWTLRVEPLAFLRSLLAWATFTVRGAPDINGLTETWRVFAGVVWSLRFEWLFYIALPLLGWLFAGTRQKGMAALSLGLAAAYWWFGRFSISHDAIKLLPFAGGFVAAYWLRFENLRKLGSSRMFGVVALACVALALFVAPRGIHWATLSLLTVVMVAACCDNPMFRLLRGPTFQHLGRVSYSVYLLHGILLWSIFHTRWTAGLPEYVFLSCCAAIPIAVVAVSTLTYRFIELPGLALGRRLTVRQAVYPAARATVALAK